MVVEQDSKIWVLLVALLLLGIGVAIYLAQRAEREEAMSRALMQESRMYQQELIRSEEENALLRQELEKLRRGGR